MKKLLGILVLGLLLNTNAQAKHKTFDYPFLHWNTFEAKGSENHYKFPKIYFKDILEYLDLDEAEFHKIIDKFRPDHLWEKKNNKWILKNAVWKDEEK